MMNFTTLAVDELDDRVTVRLNRPDKRNAIDQAMVDELHTVCGELERRPRPMLLTGGADGVFAAGADIGQLRDRTSADALRAINSGLFNRIRALPMPTIAAIDGPALGGGAELSYACDIRLCTTRSFFGQPEARWASSPGPVPRGGSPHSWVRASQRNFCSPGVVWPPTRRCGRGS